MKPTEETKKQNGEVKKGRPKEAYAPVRRPLLAKAREWLEELLKYTDEINKQFATLYQISRFFGEKHQEIRKQAEFLDKWSHDEAFNRYKVHLLQMFDSNGVDGLRENLIELMSQIDGLITDINHLSEKIKAVCIKIEEVKKQNATRQAELLDKYLQHLTEVLSYLWHIEQSPTFRGGAEVSVLWRENDKVYSSLLKVYDSLLRKYGKICYENNIRK